MPTPSTPYVGLGTQFQFATVAAPTVFTTLAGVHNVAYSGDKVNTDKTTNMQSTNGAETYIASTFEPGSVDIKAQALRGDATHLSILAIRDAKLPVNFQELKPGGGFVTFSGIVESYTETIPLDKVATVDIKIKITGPIVRELS